MSELLPIEREVLKIVKTRRIRIAEFFKDFDRLRSGKISKSQFCRSLNQVLGSARSDDMKPAEEESLVAKYQDENNMIDYRAFTQTIDSPFDPDNLISDGGCDKKKLTAMEINSLQNKDTFEYLGVKGRSHESRQKINAILTKLEAYYDYHGIDLRHCFEDFARHNNGIVTCSQFERSFPGKDNISFAELKTLTDYYIDPYLDGRLVNYLNFHLDINQVRLTRKCGDAGENDGDAGDYDLKNLNKRINDIKLEDEKINEQELRSVFDRLHVAIFKNRIRTTEFFRDHDKLRSGIITRNQFIRGLTLAQDGVQLGASLLTTHEINKIADFYSDSNDMVKYRKFCDRMENTFNIPLLEKQPTKLPTRPDPKELQTKLAHLEDAEETRLQELIQEIKQYVTNRRIMLYPYFKDFDRGAGYTRTVTKGQFTRILNFSGVKLSPTDLDIVYRKYRDPVTGDVLYPAFSVAVEAEFGQYIKDDKDAVRYGVNVDDFHAIKSKSIPGQDTNSENDRFAVKSLSVKRQSTYTVNETVALIKEFIYKNRIRGETFFQDFDQLRTGLVTKSIFLRCLDAMGISISPNEAESLAENYKDQNKPDCVRWSQFLNEVKTHYTSSEHFTKTCGLPEEPIPPRAKIPGTTQFDDMSFDEQEIIKAVLNRMMGRVQRRRLLMKPVFQDFDKHNHGYVTANQFKRVLTLLQLGCTTEESKLITKLYSDNMGFNYTNFIQTLAPYISEETKYEAQKLELQNLGKKTTKQATGMNRESYATLLPKNESDIYKQAMIRLKTLVFKERIRVYEWMKDYDKLRSGSIKKSSFRRALDLCGVGDVLVEPEIQSIMKEFTNKEKSDYVMYLNLCAELESTFTTPDLDKNPQAHIEQFRPPIEWEKNDLEEQEESIFKMAMYRLGEHIKKTRIQLYPLFEDYDRVHNATVSRSQFHRVLSELEMGGLLSEQEFRVIFKKFNMTRGGKNDVNYVAFCDWFKQGEQDFNRIWEAL
jgi:Ca2+-binding EF-hand superfamily protein